MDNSSDKLKRILNELAILNQPEQKNGKIAYGLSQLKQIKLLCSEAYILSDLSVTDSTKQFIEPDAPKVVQKEEKIEIKEEPKPIVEKKPEPVIADLVEPTKPEAIIQDPKEEANVEPIVQSEIPKPKEENSVIGKSFSSSVSMTRRFEYINKLFKGESDSYTKFVSNLEKSNLTESLIAYEDMYNQLEWNRKQESADEFKRLIIKFFE